MWLLKSNNTLNLLFWDKFPLFFFVLLFHNYLSVNLGGGQWLLFVYVKGKCHTLVRYFIKYLFFFVCLFFFIIWRTTLVIFPIKEGLIRLNFRVCAFNIYLNKYLFFDWLIKYVRVEQYAMIDHGLGNNSVSWPWNEIRIKEINKYKKYTIS